MAFANLAGVPNLLFDPTFLLKKKMPCVRSPSGTVFPTHSLSSKENLSHPFLFLAEVPTVPPLQTVKCACHQTYCFVSHPKTSLKATRYPILPSCVAQEVTQLPRHNWSENSIFSKWNMPAEGCHVCEAHAAQTPMQKPFRRQISERAQGGKFHQAKGGDSANGSTLITGTALERERLPVCLEAAVTTAVVCAAIC